MNEKIKELAEQAKIHFSRVGILDGDPNGSAKMVSYSKMEKFAELIVKECTTAFEAEVDTWKEMDPYQGSIKRQGTKAIKKHFGVEV